ncbi:MAG: type II toxin-antitoxin system RelE/ParE family toxin [Candidatus Sulfotelmatobacter sp.]
MTVRWSPEAAADFAAIVEYIRKQNPAAAERVAHTIFEGIASLASFPKQGRPGRIRGTRELAFSPFPFIAVYRVGTEAVEVARVLHGSQRWP